MMGRAMTHSFLTVLSNSGPSYLCTPSPQPFVQLTWYTVPVQQRAIHLSPSQRMLGMWALHNLPLIKISQCRYLGQNSKRTKIARQLGDVQIKMRLRVSGSRDEIRQDYLPLLASKIILPLISKKAPAVRNYRPFVNDALISLCYRTN
jgi:hypothetical protein